MNSKRIALLLFVFVGIGSLWTACSSDSVLSGDARVTVLLTDAPIDFSGVSAVNVTFDAVTLKREEDGGEDEDGGKLRLLTDGPMTINLLDYQNGATIVLAEGEVESGDFAKIRLHLIDAELVRDDDGDPDTPEIVEPIFTPARKVDVNAPFSLTAGEEMTVTIDFDAEQSVQVNATNGVHPYILRPVIQVVGMD